MRVMTEDGEITLEEAIERLTGQKGNPLDMAKYGPPIPMCPEGKLEQRRHKLVAHRLLAERRILEARITALNDELEAEHDRWTQTLRTLHPEMEQCEGEGRMVRISDDGQSYHISLPGDGKGGHNEHMH